MKKINLFVLMLFCAFLVKAQYLPGYSVITTSSDPSVSVYDMNAAPPGTGANWVNPAVWTVPRSQVGNIFGVAVNTAVPVPQIYVASFGMYFNTPVTYPNGSGAIYKIDAASHAVTSLTTTTTTDFNTTNIGTNHLYQSSNTSGRGIGNICLGNFSNATYVYATNLDDGLIYQINASTGNVVSVTKPSYTPLISILTQKVEIGQLSWGIAINGDKLVFARYNLDYMHNTASGIHNQIYQMDINPVTGIPITSTEIIVQNLPYFPSADIPGWMPTIFNPFSNPVSDIEFSNSGIMLCAEKSMFNINSLHSQSPQEWAHLSRVLEFTSTTGTLMAPHFIGNGGKCHNTSGGIDYDMNPIVPSDDRCGRIWSTGDALIFTPPYYCYGAAGVPLTANAANPTPIIGTHLTSTYMDADNNLTGAPKDQIGDIDFYRTDCCPKAAVKIEVPSKGCVGDLINFNFNITKCPDCVNPANINWTIFDPSMTPIATLTGLTPTFTFTSAGTYTIQVTYSDDCAQLGFISTYTILIEDCDCKCDLKVIPSYVEHDPDQGTIFGGFDIFGGSKDVLKVEMNLAYLNFEAACNIDCDQLLSIPSHFGAFTSADPVNGTAPLFENCFGDGFSKDVTWNLSPTGQVGQSINYVLDVPRFPDCDERIRFCIKVRIQYTDCSYCDCMFCWDGTSLVCTCLPKGDGSDGKDPHRQSDKNVTEHSLIVPNPNDGSFKLMMPTSNEQRNINVTDLQGKLIRHIVLSQDLTQFELKDFESGLYNVEIKTGNSSENLKVVVAK